LPEKRGLSSRNENYLFEETEKASLIPGYCMVGKSGEKNLERKKTGKKGGGRIKENPPET